MVGMEEELKPVFIVGEAKPIRVEDKKTLEAILGKLGTPVFEFNELDILPGAEEDILSISQGLTLKLLIVGGNADGTFSIYVDNQLKLKVKNSAATPTVVIPLGSGLYVENMRVACRNNDLSATGHFHVAVIGVR